MFVKKGAVSFHKDPLLFAMGTAIVSLVMPASPVKGADNAESIVVTGTRETNRQASESLTPIDVVSEQALRGRGAGDLRDSLVSLLPSLTRQTQPYNASALTNALSLRGLSPDHVLVLVNGKRRHQSGNINVSGGLQNGSTGVDVDTIPLAAIERVEILRDGASAQYGSDAVAGVINIILKDNDHGGLASLTAGQFYEGDGFRYGGGASAGLKLGSRGFLTVSAEFRDQDHTVRSGIDQRTGKRDNLASGDPAIRRISAAYNAGIALGESASLYSFGTFMQRDGSSRQNYRLPSLLPAVYPQGFTPLIRSDEQDFSVTAGVKGSDLLGGWNWDISTTYGVDAPDLNMRDSANTALYADTGQTPTRFHLASYRNRQWTNTVDLSRTLEPGFVSSLTLALGGEHRREIYEVGAGDDASWYNGGAQALPGLSPVSAGRWSRTVFAGYADVATEVVPGWHVDAAGRYEHYSDFGSTTNGRIATRIVLSPSIAVRGSAGTGFRAPSLVQQNFTSLGVSPDIALGLLAANSPAARLLGGRPLKPEKSTNFNLGFVLTPAPELSLTVDAYQVRLRDRIVDGGAFSGQDALDALLLAGITLPSGLTSVSTHYLSNGANTRTRGIDLTGQYRLELGEAGRIDWTLAANFNRTRLLSVKPSANGEPLLNAKQIAWITSATPRSRISFGGTWKKGGLSLNVRETRFGRTYSKLDFVTGPDAWSTSVFNPFTNTVKYTTDIEASAEIGRGFTLAAGANNLFDERPDQVPPSSAYLGVDRYDTYASQIGTGGGFYYGRVTYAF